MEIWLLLGLLKNRVTRFATEFGRLRASGARPPLYAAFQIIISKTNDELISFINNAVIFRKVGHASKTFEKRI